MTLVSSSFSHWSSFICSQKRDEDFWRKKYRRGVRCVDKCGELSAGKWYSIFAYVSNIGQRCNNQLQTSCRRPNHPREEEICFFLLLFRLLFAEIYND